jgi:asparagine synthase (glutamine-hydrolysing)
MSRIATFHSLRAGSEETSRMHVTNMLSAMPGRSARIVKNGLAVCGWAGFAGGGVYANAAVCLAIDGEIFNFEDLANTFKPRPQSDAELVALLYGRHGFAEALSRLNGDFAITLYDQVAGRLWIGRDRVGIKPIYYVLGNKWVASASQPSGLLAIPEIKPEINRRYTALIASSHYRTFDNVPEESPFANMFQVPAAHFLEIDVDRGAKRCTRY